MLSPSLHRVWRFVRRDVLGRHDPVRSFDSAVKAAGGIESGVDRGTHPVPTRAIVGSVGRWQNLRSDFFYRTGQAMTQRFYRIGQAMDAGKVLPPLELYKLRRKSSNASASPISEYYVVDGHHRVAMARLLGQDFLDAHITEFQSAGDVESKYAHTLRRIRLFKDAPTADLVALWRNLTEARVPAGSVICRRGDEGDRLYIVQTGRVEVRLGIGPESLSLYQLGPGDCFGEMALLTGEPRSADVVSLEDSTLWVLEKARFDEVVNQSLPMLRALNRSVVQRLGMATQLIKHAGLIGAAGAAGLQFGPYRVIGQIGAGGMSVVYSAAREDNGLAVALKVLPASWGSAPELRERLNREAAILGRIQHPGLVRLLEIGAVPERLGGGTYIAMEWVPDALDRLMAERYPEPLEPAHALRIAQSVAAALAAVHAVGLIHRDVKPANILLRASGEPVLTDFGLAEGLAEVAGEHRLTPANMLVGTADYVAPEMVAGDAVDARADIYSLGVVLYEMLAGFVPFAGLDPLQTLVAHRDLPIPALPDSVPANIRAVVDRALQKDAAQRFSSADVFARAIAELLVA